MLNSESILRRRAASPAAARWQVGLIRGLMRHRPVRLFSHVPERLWPGGRQIRLGPDDGDLPSGIHGRILEYLNLPLIRPQSLGRAYSRGLDDLASSDGRPTAVVTYNAPPWLIRLGRHAQERWNIPWIVVVADAPGEGPAFERHEREIGMAAGRVFLSWARYAGADGDPKLHLDGGVDGPLFREAATPGADEAPQVLLFAGAMTRWAGSSELIEAFARIPDPGVELWLCGHGHNPRVEAASQRDDRIRWLGMLSEARLRATFQRASIFVNPRATHLHDNRSNFPSKVLEYLSYGKPVVSTWTEGLAPGYRDVLVLAATSGPRDLAAALRRALDMTPDDRIAYADRALAFLRAKQWSDQARRLDEWLTDSVLPQWRR